MSESTQYGTPRDGLGPLHERIRRLERAVRDLQGAAPLRQSGVTSEPDGLTADRSLTVHGDFTSTGDASIGGTLDVSAETTIGGTLDVTGETALGGPTTVSGDTRVIGDLEVVDGGYLRVRYPEEISGRPAVFFGRIVGDVTGTYQGTGLLLARPEPGRSMMQARTDQDAAGHVIELFDNSQNSVVGIYPHTERGLNRPTLSLPMSSADYRTWGSTSSAEWRDVARGASRVWHQHIWANCSAVCDDSGTTGQLRLIVVHDDVEYAIGSPADVAFAISSHTFEAPIPAAIPIGGFVHVKLQARVVSGSGSIHGSARYVEMQP